MHSKGRRVRRTDSTRKPGKQQGLASLPVFGRLVQVQVPGNRRWVEGAARAGKGERDREGGGGKVVSFEMKPKVGYIVQQLNHCFHDIMVVIGIAAKCWLVVTRGPSPTRWCTRQRLVVCSHHPQLGNNN